MDYSSNIFVVSWDQTGLECILPVTEITQNGVFEALKIGKSTAIETINKTVGMMVMRARYNTHRHYEIYSFTASEGISESDIRDYFENAPQMAADWVRENGTMIFSDRAVASTIKIT